MYNTDNEIGRILSGIRYDYSGIEWEELHKKNKEELLKAGLIEKENGLFIIPKIYYKAIPDGMVLTSNYGRHKIHYAHKHRYECQEYYYHSDIGFYGIDMSDPDHDKLTIEEPKSFEEYFRTVDLFELDRDERECVKSLIENDVLLTTAKQLFERLKVYKKIKNKEKEEIDEANLGNITLTAEQHFDRLIAAKSKELFDETRTIFDIEDFSRAKLIREGKRACSVDEGRYARKDGSDKFRFPNWDDLFDMVKEAEKVNGDINAVFAGAEMYASYLGYITEEHKAVEKYQFYQTYKQFKKEAPDFCALLEDDSDKESYFIYRRGLREKVFVTLVKHPEVFKTLLSAKDNNEKPLFTPYDIPYIYCNMKESIKYHPDRIKAVLSNPEEIERIAGKENKAPARAFALTECMRAPLASTKEQYPQAFRGKSKDVTEKTKNRIETAKSKISSEKTPAKNNEHGKPFDFVKGLISKIKDRRKH